MAAKACDQMCAEDPAEIERGYRTLASFQEFGALSDQYVRAAITAARGKILSLPNVSSAQLDALQARLDGQLRIQETGNGQDAANSAGGASWFSEAADRLTTFAEGFIDPSDAVRRRKTSDRIYKALIAEQISLQKAAAELKTITARQKGGWLAKSIARRAARLSSGDRTGRKRAA